MKYKIVRNYYSSRIRNRIIERGLTLEEAQKHCSNPETSSSTGTSAKAKRITRNNGPWFDSYAEEK